MKWSTFITHKQSCEKHLPQAQTCSCSLVTIRPTVVPFALSRTISQVHSDGGRLPSPEKGPADPPSPASSPVWPEDPYHHGVWLNREQHRQHQWDRSSQTAPQHLPGHWTVGAINLTYTTQSGLFSHLNLHWFLSPAHWEKSPRLDRAEPQWRSARRPAPFHHPGPGPQTGLFSHEKAVPDGEFHLFTTFYWKFQDGREHTAGQ